MTAEDTLFDAGGYGPARARRTKVAHVEEIKLAGPWVLLGHARGGPLAHILNPGVMANKDGARLAACGRLGYPIAVGGQPMAKVCRSCWDHADHR